MQPPALVTIMAHQAVLCKRQTGRTFDIGALAEAAGVITVHLFLSGFPPSPGAVLHQDAKALRLRMKRPIAAAGTSLRGLATVVSVESEEGCAGPGATGGPEEGHSGGFRTGRAVPQSRVVVTLE